MSWKSALKKSVEANASKFSRPVIDPYKLDPAKIISLDTETYYDQDYTLRKLNTSSYVRDPRFKLQMVGVKEGRKPTKVMTEKQFKVWAKTVPWKDRALLCHHTHFDGFILSHHYGIVPGMYLDTLSMARGLHSNEVDGDLDSVAKFYGGRGKIEGILEKTKGVRDWSPALFKEVGTYCVQDVDEMHRIFWLMHAKMPGREMELIDLIVRMFCDPVLKVNIPKVRAEHAREVAKRKELFFSAVTAADYEPGGEHYDKDLHKKLIKGPAERALTGEDRDMLICKRLLGNNEWFADQLRKVGIEPAKKVSPAWMKASPATRDDDGKYIYAFGKDDIGFTSLPEQHELWRGDLDPNKKADVVQIAARKIHLEIMVGARLASKSTNNITRAERFIVAGDNGMSLPVGYAYSRAHTHRLGGSNKMNMQNLQRGGELRESIEAPPGYELAVCDSAQIEARMNAWFWEQEDLVEAFRLGRDIYSEFASKSIYHRELTKKDTKERFVGKTSILGLGFQMGAPKLQLTLAKGIGGVSAILTLNECHRIVNAYRSTYFKIRNGWAKCQSILEDMATGRTGSYKCISWEKETIWLPNGMCLKYPGLKAAINEDTGWMEFTYLAKGIRSKIYGGLLCENIIQALARIVVMYQMLEINKKYRAVMTTHDEVVALAKALAAEKCFQFMLGVMRTPPSWAPGLPLNAEGGHAFNYSK